MLVVKPVVKPSRLRERKERMMIIAQEMQQQEVNPHSSIIILNFGIQTERVISRIISRSYEPVYKWWIAIERFCRAKDRLLEFFEEYGGYIVRGCPAYLRSPRARDMTSFMSDEVRERARANQEPFSLHPHGKYTCAQAYRVSQGI